MTALVDQEVVERTWRRLGALPARDMLRLQRNAGKLQPELVGFVLGFTSDLLAEAAGLALYVMIVVLEMFRSASARSMRKLDELAVMRLWHESQQAVRASLEAPPGSDPLIALLADSSEPAAFEYVFDAFTDMEQEDPVALTDEELEQLLAVLRTFVEGLHHASSP
jgi:hypothetical protein